MSENISKRSNSSGSPSPSLSLMLSNSRTPTDTLEGQAVNLSTNSPVSPRPQNQTEQLRTSKVVIKHKDSESSPTKSRTTRRITVPQNPPFFASIADSEGYQGPGSLSSSSQETISLDSSTIINESSSESRRRSNRLVMQEKRDAERKERELDVAKRIEEGDARTQSQTYADNDNTEAAIKEPEYPSRGRSSESLLSDAADIDTSILSDKLFKVLNKSNPDLTPSSSRSTSAPANDATTEPRRKSKRIQESANTTPKNGTQNPGQELILKRRKLDEGEFQLFDQPVLLTTPTGETEFNEPPIADTHIAVNGKPWACLPKDRSAREKTSKEKSTKERISKDKNNKEVPKKYKTTAFLAEPRKPDITKNSLELVSQNEKSLNGKLTTNMSQNLERTSSIRDGSKNDKRSSINNYLSKSTSLLSPKINPKSVSKSSSKAHVKATTSPVKRPVASLAVGTTTVHPIELHTVKLSQAEDTLTNNDFCSTCGDTGVFLCCESCPKSFHFSCCSPPYYDDNLPENSWFCHECSVKKTGITKETGMFGKLLMNLEVMDPVQFRLPKRIRERFQNVYTAPNGSYSDDSMKNVLASQRPKNHLKNPNSEDFEFYVDKETRIPLRCQKCGDIAHQLKNEFASSQMIVKPMITCDYCPLSWHIDCLNPPMSTVKQLGRKWFCPAHLEDIIMKQRRLKKGQVYIDRDIPFGTENNGDIEIVEDEDRSDEENSNSSVPWIRGRDTPNGIAAKISPQQETLWKSQEAGIVRLPERSIIVDFTQSVLSLKQMERDAKIKELLDITRENNALLRTLTIGTSRSVPAVKGGISEANHTSGANLDAEERLALVGLVDLKKG